MAEFTEIVRLANRICKETENCEKCMMSLGDTECLFGYRPDFIMENAEKIEKSIMEWAAEHPAPRYPTWREWQVRMFPYRDRNIIPCAFDDSSRFNCEAKSCGQCIDEPIPADIAEKLGIKPIEED